MIHANYITHVIYITLKLKLTFKAYKKTNRVFLIIFSIYKNKHYQSHKEKFQKEAKLPKLPKSFWRRKKGEKRLEKDIKTLLKKKKKRKCQYYCERNKNLPEEQKQKLVEYIV